MTRRRDRSAEEKVEIVLAGIKGAKSIAQICRDNNISQTTYYNWRDKFLDSTKSAFRNGTSSDEKALQNKIEDLDQIIGKLTVENEILKKQSLGTPIDCKGKGKLNRQLIPARDNYAVKPRSIPSVPGRP